MSNYYLVSQNKSHGYEFAHRILWSPQLTVNGKHNAGYDAMSRVRDGDVIFHVYNQHLHAVSRVVGDAYEQTKPEDNSFQDWDDLGWQVDCDMALIDVSLQEHQIWFQSHSGGPFDKNGHLIQSYLTALTTEQTNYLFSLITDKQVLVQLIGAPEISNRPETLTLTEANLPSRIKRTKNSKSIIKQAYDPNLNRTKSHIGFLGEKAVFDYLKNRYSSSNFSVKGLSSNLSSSGDDSLGYDICLTNLKTKEIDYIDVKSTKGKSDIFYMSEKERQIYLKSKNGDYNYLIYRVFDLDEATATGRFDVINLTHDDDELTFQPVDYQVSFKQD
ncbi:hypothetical protein ATX60_09965 [Oenococcus oeni]|uniref:protein NO VEIN domain-containing protein n=1 Tax=Oenococcus oeni TaxID=1247 RepID=UPI0008F95AF8|nr:DUF3883 domain-containing protein [Oenococcus oeni]OIM22344.1 hypothetical protein ATX60_09965 [Oenococcus oeni]